MRNTGKNETLSRKILHKRIIMYMHMICLFIIYQVMQVHTNTLVVWFYVGSEKRKCPGQLYLSS